MPDATEVLEWRGRTAVDPEGSKLGKIEEIYLDDETEQPEWALINTGLFGGAPSFMPLRDATSNGDLKTIVQRLSDKETKRHNMAPSA